ncbi:PAS domain S-box protein [Pseudomonadota bacterium]
MNNAVIKTPQLKQQLTRSAITVACVWTLISAVSLFWNVYNEKEHTQHVIKNEARAHFNKDQAFRYWATAHGGVYVPTNKRTPANPSLGHIPERDIDTPSGKQLTLMNPAYMVRQLMEEYSELYGVKGRIVSLKPLREKNAPDEWERKALLAFEQGVKEVFEIANIDGQPYLRLMSPMVTKEGCLKCHGIQGYKVGDIRGGVGVSVAMTPYLAIERDQIEKLMLSHVFIWLLGIVAIYVNHQRSKRADLKQKETYTALLKSQQEYSDLYENAPDMYISVDAKSALVKQCNQTTADALNYDKSDIIGHPIFNLYHPDSIEGAHNAFKSFVETGYVHDAELQLMRKDGSKLDVSLNVSAVRDDKGNVLVSRSTWRDITERKRDKEELTKVRHHLQNIIDSMPSMLVGVSSDGVVTHWNYEAERVSGITTEQATGQLIDQVLPQLSNEMDSIKETIRNRTPQLVKHLTQEHNNENRYADVMIYPLFANAEVGAVIRIDDTTERVRMEQLMTQTEKMMSVGGLAAGMAHELNNPLGGILQGLQNIQRRLSPELDKNQAVAQELNLDLNQVQTYIQRRDIDNFMKGMTEAGQRAADIVQNMLNFSRKADSNRSIVSLTQLIDRTLELASVDYDLKKTYDFRSIEIVREFDPELPTVTCIPSEIQQVLLNLLRNAAQALYTQPDPISPPCIIVRTLCKSGHACIEIEDNGPGIDEATSKRVFEPFFTTRPLGEGTGLGLSVSYFIIHDEHGGQISVKSQPGQGATFTVTLPIVSVAERR